MLSLISLLNACHVPLNKNSYKIHLATGGCLDAFFAGEFKQWQEHQTKRNFSRDMVLSLLKLDAPDKWLFAGVYDVLGPPREGNCGHFFYNTKLLPGQDNLIGRVIVHHERVGRPSYRVGTPGADAYVVSALLPEKMSIGEFPGYKSVCETFGRVKTIIRQSVPSWKSALQSVKGVYLITDKQTGKLYIGSATGLGGIWQRWNEYAATGHGGNRDLRDILKTGSPGYAEHFQFSILEVADTHTSDDEIKRREQFWKNIFQTRPHGLNSN